MLSFVYTVENARKGNGVLSKRILDILEHSTHVRRVLNIGTAALPQVGIVVTSAFRRAWQTDNNLGVLAAQAGCVSVATVPHLVRQARNACADLVRNTGLASQRLMHRVDRHVHARRNILHGHSRHDPPALCLVPSRERSLH